MHRRLIWAIFIALALALLPAALSPARAQSITVKTDDVMIDGGTTGANADFGAGFHGTGHPFQFGHVQWDLSTVGGSLMVKATVSGTVYYDSLNSTGCARLFIKFVGDSGTKQVTVDTQCPAPGGDANLSANKTSV